MLKTISKAALLLSSGLGLIGGSQVALAQVAPTEVNEEAVDDHGMDRKTGRFTWSTGELIGIGGEGSRLGIAVTGVRSPANATSYLPNGSSLPVILNRPRISISPRPVDFPLFPGEIDPNRDYVTVEFGGSYTFDCTSVSCTSQYFFDYSLEPVGSGYRFTTKSKVEVLFETDKTTVSYPDGREEIYQSNGVLKNNFGFMLRYAGTTSSSVNVVAVNLAEDYCSDDPTVVCNGLSANRTASLPTTYPSTLNVVDAEGGVTKIRWVSKSAKERRPIAGPPQPGDPIILSLTSRYPLGITLPGSTSEDITIAYGSYDPNTDTHDDIRVSSITKHGVTVDYEMAPYWPFGRDPERPDQPPPGAGVELSGVVFNGWLNTQQENPAGELMTCQNILPPVYSADQSHDQTFEVCTGFNSPGAGGIGSGGGISVPTIPTEPAPPDPDAPELNASVGSQIYELVIRARIGNELISESKALRPYDQEGMARRRLVYVEDALGRKTTYFYNHYDEVAGVTLPEGNGTLSGQDIRGNTTLVATLPKNSSNPSLETQYSYPAQCDSTNENWCNSPISMTDPNGNTTNYEYNQYGQLTKEMGPAPSAGAARPTVINEYTLRTAYIKNSSGSPIAAGPAISLLTKSFTCITAANCSASTPAADKIVTEYDYGPTSGLNNLLLRGMTVTAVNDQGQIETLRTCYQYNYFGERIAETQPKAGLTSCQ